jgi:hypothetical protein
VFSSILLVCHVAYFNIEGRNEVEIIDIDSPSINVENKQMKHFILNLFRKYSSYPFSAIVTCWRSFPLNYRIVIVDL